VTPKRPALLPVELWEQLSEPLQIVISAMVDYYEQRIAELEAEVRELTARLDQTSQNSSKPPSSDGPHVKRKPPKPPSGRKPGGQPGHTPHQRALVPVDNVDQVIACKPEQCRRCGRPLTGSDPAPWRQQVMELPPVRAHLTEYQRHRLKCSRCGITTCGELPTGVLSTGYGPRLASVVALCTGGYRMSKRMAASFCREGLGIELSVGEIGQIDQTVTNAVTPAVEEAAVYVQSCDANIDETPWREQRQRRWLWARVTAQISVVTVAKGRGAAVLQALVGEWYSSILTSDRAKAYDSHPLRKRQLCLAHLCRDFQAMIDRGGPSKGVGEALLEHVHVLFTWWHWVRDGTWQRSTFQSYVRTLRASFKLGLEWGTQNACPKTAATCRELLAREAAVWTFVRVEGIEPTNNSAERHLRHAVLWRKVSYGTQSARGSRFVASRLTVLTSCQQQGRHALTYLTVCCQAFYANRAIPSLVP
jgi:transposase